MTKYSQRANANMNILFLTFFFTKELIFKQRQKFRF